MPVRLGSLLLVLGAACASARGNGLDPSATTVSPATGTIIPGSSGVATLNSNVTSTVTAISSPVRLPPDSAFRLLAAAYAKLGIPVARVSPSNRSIGNDGLKARRKLAGMNMQDIVDCGDKMGLPNAETWDMQIDILSYVTPDGHDRSQLSTRIDATGHDPSVSGRDWVNCESKSALEAKIAAAVTGSAPLK